MYTRKIPRFPGMTGCCGSPRHELFKRVLALRGEEAALQVTAVMSLETLAELTQEVAINAALWTQDADFAGIEGVRYVPKG